MMTSGVILAGGLNSRMGGYPKGKLRLDGDLFVQRLQRIVSARVDDVYYSIHREVPNCLPDEPDVITDCFPDVRASMNGVYSSLEALRDPVLILPWDMPLVTDELLEKLLEPTTDGSGHGRFFRTDRGVEPFPGIYRPSMLDHLECALKDGDYSLTGLIERLNVLEIPRSELNISSEESDRDIFRNINTPEEYQKLKSVHE